MIFYLRLSTVGLILLSCFGSVAQSKLHRWHSLVDNVADAYDTGDYDKARALARQVVELNDPTFRHDTAMLHRVGRLMLGAIAQQTGDSIQANTLFLTTLDEFWRDTELKRKYTRQFANPLENPARIFWENRPADDRVLALRWYYRWSETLRSQSELGRTESLLVQMQPLAGSLFEEGYWAAQSQLVEKLGQFYRDTLRDIGLFNELRQLTSPSVYSDNRQAIRIYLYRLKQLDTNQPEARRILAALTRLRNEAFANEPTLQVVRSTLRSLLDHYVQIAQWDQAERAAEAYYLEWYACSTTNQHRTTLDALRGWAQILTEQGRYKRADSLLNIAEKTAPLLPTAAINTRAYVSNSRALWHSRQGRDRAAATSFNQALAFLRSSSRLDTLLYTTIVLDLMEQQLANSRQWSTVEQYYADLRRFGANRAADQLLARVRLAQGRLTEAQSLLQPWVAQVQSARQSLNELSDVRLRIVYAQTLKTTQLDESRRWVQEAGQRLVRQLTKVTSSLTQRTNESLMQQYFDELINQQIEAYVAADLTEELFDFLLIVRSHQILPLRRVNQQIIKSDTATQRRYQSYQEWSNQLVAYQQAKHLSSAGTTVEALADQAERELRRVLTSATPIMRWQEVRQALQNDEAVVEFITVRSTKLGQTDKVWYYALVLRPGEQHPKLIKLFEEGQLRRWLPASTGPPGVVEQFYRGGVVGESSSKLADSLRLYRLLWQPLDSLLTRTKVVYLVPMGLLHNVSFAAIRRPDGSLLIDHLRIQYRLNCGQIVTPVFFQLPAQSPVMLVGNIAYDLSRTMLTQNQQQQGFLSDKIMRVLGGSNLSGMDTAALRHYYMQLDSVRKVRQTWTDEKKSGKTGLWKPLPETKIEVDSIGQQLIQNRHRPYLLTDIEADEWRFRKVADSLQPAIIHVAGHGFYDLLPDDSIKTEGRGLSPLLRSGLVMSGANFAHLYPALAAENDGMLSALDVSTLNLANTQLVVLSACETGLGDVRGVEGVFGLQRAFKLAGANYLLQSLWKVPDPETRFLMNTFYVHLLNGQPIETAFYEAQRLLRAKFSPYHWAAFVLIQ